MEKKFCDNLYLNMANLIPFEEKYYFWAKNCNGFFSYDDSTKECKFIARERNEPLSDKLRYSKGIRVKEYIVFAPFFSTDIYIYDLKRKQERYVSIGRPGYFVEICHFHGWIYFWKNSEILRMSVGEWKIENVESDANMMCSHICKMDDMVYTLSMDQDEIMRIDLNTCCVEKIKISNNGMRYNTIIEDKGNLFLSGDKFNLVKWDIRSKLSTLFDLPSICRMRDEMPTEFLFTGSEKDESKIFFAPAKLNSLISFDLSTDKVQIESILNEDETWAAILKLKSFLAMITDKRNTVYHIAANYKISKNKKIEKMVLFQCRDTEKIKPGRWEIDSFSLKMFLNSLPTNTLEKKMTENYETGSDISRRIGDAIKALYV